MSSSYFTRHKRSKSASDKNLESSSHETPHCLEKGYCPAKNWATQNGAEDDHHCTNKINNEDSVDQRVSLESDIKKLQLHLRQEKAMRLMLERAIGRASSTLSPGHRHFTAKTKDLIAEIELLEEEIANREQHVLFLYRSIFDQCLSASSSRQSSVVASPAHTKNASKKHPSIISSTICSSKKSVLQSFQVLSQDVMKKLPTERKTYIARTLKDQLYRCPSNLSEELLRCMAAVYYWMRCDTPVKPEKASLFSSRSSLMVEFSSSGGADDGKDLSCQSTVEISSISVDKVHLSRAAHAVSNYRLLVEQLERVDVSALGGGAKLAFWINVYNSLVMHAYLAYGVSHGPLRRLALFHKAAYNIGGHIISANSIEHSILHCRTPRFGRWFEAIISTAMRKKSAEEKLLFNSCFTLPASQPLVLFALCIGGFSDPMLRIYSAKNVIAELDNAKKDFLRANVIVKKSRKIFLPKLLGRFAKEAALSCEELVDWLSANTEEKSRDDILKCINGKSKKGVQAIEWLPYNSKFRYAFAKDLTDKPWWL